MSDAVMIAVISALGLVLSGVLVELVRTRKAVGSNGGSSLHDGLKDVRIDVREIRKEQTKQGERIAKLEARSA